MQYVLGLAEQLGAVAVGDLTTEFAARFVARRATLVCANTIRGEIGYLRAACNYAIEEGYLEHGPRWRRVTPRRSAPMRTILHQREDIGRVLELLKTGASTWAGHRLFALASLVAYTGLRRDEALRMRIEDVRLSSGVLYVVARTRLKTEASEAPVPIPPDLAEVLTTWIPLAGSEWLVPGARRLVPWMNGRPGTRPIDRLKAAGRDAGIEGLTFQSLRHTFATYARHQWGLSDLELMTVLRHTSPGTQRAYVHALPGHGPLVESVRAVSYK